MMAAFSLKGRSRASPHLRLAKHNVVQRLEAKVKKEEHCCVVGVDLGDLKAHGRRGW
jgi:hypothetical protein